MQVLKNKNILLGVTASIAIYKSLELIRLYIKAGANVKVIMTKSAKKFITPLTFETLSQNKVLCDDSEDWSFDTNNNHIAIGKWADIFVIAPATANTINKLSNGIADNMLTQTALAYPNVKILAPAANTNMMLNPITKASLKMLNLCNFTLIEPIEKELACKDEGVGALANIEDIFAATARELLQDPFYINRKVVLNGGATIETIDDVRYISNFSSGKMAVALAEALYYKGADVCIVLGENSVKPKYKAIHTISVQNAQEMKDFVEDCLRVAKKGKLSSATLMDNSTIEHIQKKPIFFGVSAVSDFTPKYPQVGKLKKADIGDTWSIELKENIDILNSINKDGIISIGFKAEMDKQNALSYATNMLEKKQLDGVCLNIIDQDNSFGSDTNNITFISKNRSNNISGNKISVALKVLEEIKTL